MKKTVRINISGLIFTIDEDAYNKLQQYLNSITKKFLDTKEGNEIIADVEARIAELFQERIGDRKEVISIADVEYIIETMGAPEEFEDLGEEEEPAVEEPHGKKGSRRIYRDTDNRVLGGLASGIATYFNVDPTIIRVIFVLLTFFYGTSILIYVLLWIIIPEAKTRSQKLEMHGQDINLSSIETSIKSEFQHVKTNFNRWQKSDGYDNFRTNVGSVLNMFGKVLIIFVKFLLIIVGIGLLVAGIAVLVTMTGVFFMNDTFLSPFSWNGVEFSAHNFVLLFTDGFNARVGIISIYLLLLIPTLSIIYVGLKFIFKFKSKNRYLGVFAGSLWLVSLLILISSAIKIGYGMRANDEVTQSFLINNPNSDTMYIKLFDTDHINGWGRNVAHFDKISVKVEDNKIELFGEPKLDIVKSETSKTNIKIVKKASGMNRDEALRFAKNIKYEWQQQDSIFFFRRYFNVEGQQKVKGQEVDITLEIPVGKVIYLGENIDYITSYLQNVDDFNDDDYFVQTRCFWIMTDNGLRLLDEYKNDTKVGKKENRGTIDTAKTKSSNKEEIEQMKKELDDM